jgi:hypothetical protein
MPLTQKELRCIASALFHANKGVDNDNNPYVLLKVVYQILSPYTEDGGWVEFTMDKTKHWMNYKIHFADAPEGQQPPPTPPF